MAPKIESPVKGFNGQVVGVTFTDGIAKTDNEGALGYFARHGYTVGETEKQEVKIPEGKPTDVWTNAQITAWAAAHEVDLGDASKKADMLAAIEAAQLV
jgi:hypothetical protein